MVWCLVEKKARGQFYLYFYPINYKHYIGKYK